MPSSFFLHTFFTFNFCISILNPTKLYRTISVLHTTTPTMFVISGIVLYCVLYRTIAGKIWDYGGIETAQPFFLNRYFFISIYVSRIHNIFYKDEKENERGKKWTLRHH